MTKPHPELMKHFSGKTRLMMRFGETFRRCVMVCISVLAYHAWQGGYPWVALFDMGLMAGLVCAGVFRNRVMRHANETVEFWNMAVRYYEDKTKQAEHKEGE